MFSWSDYKKLAELLGSPRDGSLLKEACYRSAISRLYYSVFHASKDFIEHAFGLVLYGDSIHLQTIDHLNRNGKYLAGSNLDRLRKNRRKSDYECNVVIDDKMLVASLSFADNVIKDLSK
jgi:hypothetical protein